MTRVALLISILVVCLLCIEAKPFFGLLGNLFGNNRRRGYNNNGNRFNNGFNTFDSSTYDSSSLFFGSEGSEGGHHDFGGGLEGGHHDGGHHGSFDGSGTEGGGHGHGHDR